MEKDGTRNSKCGRQRNRQMVMQFYSTLIGESSSARKKDREVHGKEGDSMEEFARAVRGPAPTPLFYCNLAHASFGLLFSFSPMVGASY